MPQPWQPPDEAQVRDRVLDRDQLGVAAVRGDRRVDLLLEHLHHRCGTSPRQIGRRQVRVATTGQRRAIFGRFGFCITMPPPKLERGAAEVVDAGGGDRDREVVVVLDDDVVAELVDGAELHEVGVGAVLLAVDLDPQRERVGFGSPPRTSSTLARASSVIVSIGVALSSAIAP